MNPQKFPTLTHTKGLIYVSISVFTVLYTSLSKYKSISDITSLDALLIGILVVLSGLTTLRAFLDQSVVSDKKDPIVPIDTTKILPK